MTPEQFTVNVSIMVLAMVIVGGLGSIIGTYMGVALILLAPGLANSGVAGIAEALSLRLSPETLAHVPNMVYGALIVGFLLLEPMGLGKIYANIRNWFLVWPFDYVKK